MKVITMSQGQGQKVTLNCLPKIAQMPDVKNRVLQECAIAFKHWIKLNTEKQTDGRQTDENA